MIKKSDKQLIDSVNVGAYPWKDFSPETILLTDNSRKSVVMAKSHPNQELANKVHKPNEFSRTFGQPSKTLFPQDLTAEFLASQEELRQRKRRMQMDEDEAVALELLDFEDEEATEGSDNSSSTPESKSTGLENAGAAASASQGIPNVGASAVASANGARVIGPDISDLSSLTSPKNKGLSGHGLDFGLDEITQERLDAEVKAAYERGLAEGMRDVQESELQNAQTTRIAAQDLPTTDETNGQLSPEQREAAFNEGMQAGLEQGRNAAQQEAEQKYNHSMELFTKALSELQHLKGELLSTGREIFAEIAQMCADKVLRRHIQWNDQALRNVFEAAMGQFQAQDELKIEMHPEDIARLEKQIPENQRTRLRLVANSKLDRGDIKIEANSEVVSFDIEKTVEAVIDSLKDELFEDAKKDDSTEKAG
ncbi:MAG: FliH/SctL family protein [Silvanigrellaceae bacterium]